MIVPFIDKSERHASPSSSVYKASTVNDLHVHLPTMRSILQFVLAVTVGVHLVLGAPKSAKDEDPYYWWQSTVFYQIYPRSFFDSDGDGVGDLEGIRQKADYIEYLGVGGIWISPIFESPMKDFGYDISDYTRIEPIFGSMEDFDKMMAEYKKRNIKVLLDFVPNHSSDQHLWFNKSKQREDPYTDYYVWVDGEDPKTPPNDWISVFGNSSWEWCPIRKQFYFHQFLKEQPDYDFRNPKLVDELKDVLRFWLKRGIDGFRVDAVPFMIEDKQLRNEPLSHDPNFMPNEYGSLLHIYTHNLPELFPFVGGWRDVFEEFTKIDGEYRVMMVETGLTPEQTIPYYGNKTNPLADLPFNFQLFQMNNKSTGKQVYDLVSAWYNNVPEGKWPNWLLGNHDQPRIANRTSHELVDALNMMNLLLRGTPVTYYGEELGMTNLFISYNDTQDPFGINAGPVHCFRGSKASFQDRYTIFSRDPERTPMQWDDSEFSGFTTGTKPWLPVNPNHYEINVEHQISRNDSHLQTYRRLVKLRHLPAVRHSQVQFPHVTDSIFSFTRALKGTTSAIVVVINLGDSEEVVNIEQQSTIVDFRFPESGLVKAASVGSKKVDSFISLRHIPLELKQGIVIEFEPLWNDENL